VEDSSLEAVSAEIDGIVAEQSYVILEALEVDELTIQVHFQVRIGSCNLVHTTFQHRHVVSI
jgi:hypothetical protein